MNVEMFPKIYSAISYPLSAVRFVGKKVYYKAHIMALVVLLSYLES